MEILRTIKFLAFILIAFFALIYTAMITYVYFNQTSLVFQSSSLPKDFKFDYSQKFEELNIQSFDGVNLNGLLFKAENSKGLVFYLHGNAGTLQTWGSIAGIYTSLGYDIYILDYRGFGKSDGEIDNEEQLNKDVALVYDAMLKRYDEDKIVITGYSIGSGPATILASKNHPKALILQAPYYSFTELSSSKVPFFPNFMKKFNFETYRFLPKIKAPVYIFHGKDDKLISCSNGERLSKLLSTDGHFFLLSDQEHVGINENGTFQEKLKVILGG